MYRRSIYVHIYVCVTHLLAETKNLSTSINLSTNLYEYIYIYMIHIACVCVCVRVCVCVYSTLGPGNDILPCVHNVCLSESLHILLNAH